MFMSIFAMALGTGSCAAGSSRSRGFLFFLPLHHGDPAAETVSVIPAFGIRMVDGFIASFF